MSREIMSQNNYPTEITSGDSFIIHNAIKA